MLYNVFKVLISVRAKLFFGFFAMATLVILLGGYAYMSIRSAEAVVEETFDRPLMAINYARSASQVLADIKIESQELRTPGRVQTDADKTRFQDLRDAFQADLTIARERSIAPRAESLFDDVDRLRFEWQALSNGEAVLESGERQEKSKQYYDEIAENLDIIIELQTNESFRHRETAISQMKKIERYSLWAMLAALALTIIFSAWIAVTIIYPLKAAAEAARKIAAGNLDAEIPKGGADETGVLLKTMSAMKDNIRERMVKEQSLRALAQNRLAESLENSKDAVMLADSQGKIIVANGALQSMFPRIAGFELMGQPYVNFFDSSGQPKIDEALLHPEVNELQFGDGRWARVNASNTQEGGWLIIWTAITQSKDREASLRDAKEKAEAADKAKTDFLAAMSHELRTPLNAVIGFSDIIAKESLGQVGNNQYKEMAGLISQSGAHLLHIVKDVLAIADGRDTLFNAEDAEAVNLVDILDYCAKTIAKDASDKSVGILWTRPDISAFVKAKTIRLQQVFLNLLGNAVKYNKHSGKVKIAITALTDTHVQVDVMDSGIGIAQSDLSKICEPFVQVDNSHTTAYEGVGLGLSIVQKWVAQYGGTLDIQSVLGEGTRVRVMLPRLDVQQQLLARVSL